MGVRIGGLDAMPGFLPEKPMGFGDFAQTASPLLLAMGQNLQTPRAQRDPMAMQRGLAQMGQQQEKRRRKAALDSMYSEMGLGEEDPRRAYLDAFPEAAGDIVGGQLFPEPTDPWENYKVVGGRVMAMGEDGRPVVAYEPPRAPAKPPAPSSDIAKIQRDIALGYITPEQGEVLISQALSGGGDMSAREEQIERLVGVYGMDRKTAVGIADGALALRTDDYGRSAIVDLATGQERPVTTAQPPTTLDPGRPQDPGVEPGALRGGTGGEGVLSNIVNTVSDAAGAGLVAPSNEAASRTLRTLQTEAMTELATDVSGRPSNFLMEQFNSLAPTPSDITEGPDRAAGKAMETVEFLERTIARNAAVLENPRAYPPNIVAEAQRKASRLVDLRNRMYGVAVGLQASENNQGEASPGSSGRREGNRTRIRVDEDGNIIE